MGLTKYLYLSRWYLRLFFTHSDNQVSCPRQFEECSSPVMHAENNEKLGHSENKRKKLISTFKALCRHFHSALWHARNLQSLCLLWCQEHGCYGDGFSSRVLWSTPQRYVHRLSCTMILGIISKYLIHSLYRCYQIKLNVKWDTGMMSHLFKKNMDCFAEARFHYAALWLSELFKAKWFTLFHADSSLLCFNLL